MLRMFLAALQRCVPLFIVTTFLLVPSVSTRIFLTFKCDTFGFDQHGPKRYLHNDPTLSCDSGEYQSLRYSAYVMIGLWPVGVPLLYLFLLWGFKRRLSVARHSNSDPIAIMPGTSFLHSDYVPGLFWWEVVPMSRKLALTGWILFIDEGQDMGRVVLAVLINVCVLVAQILLTPHKRCAFKSTFIRFRGPALYHESYRLTRRREDRALSMLKDISLVIIYFCVFLIKICGSADLCLRFGFASTPAGELCPHLCIRMLYRWHHECRVLFLLRLISVRARWQW